MVVIITKRGKEMTQKSEEDEERGEVCCVSQVFAMKQNLNTNWEHIIIYHEKVLREQCETGIISKVNPANVLPTMFSQQSVCAHSA